MRTLRRVTLGATIALAGCGGAQASAATPVPEAATGAEQQAEIPSTEWLTLPDPAGGTAPIEPRVILDAPHLKLVAIVLRDGTVLPEHTAPGPVTIQAVVGQGVARVGDEARPLDPTHMVVLAPLVPHAIEPAPGTDMVVLVHHLRDGHGGAL